MEMFLTGPTFWKEASLFLFCKTFHTPSMLKLKQPQPRCHLSVPGGGEFAARALPAPPADGEHDRNGSISVPEIQKVKDTDPVTHWSQSNSNSFGKHFFRSKNCRVTCTKTFQVTCFTSAKLLLLLSSRKPEKLPDIEIQTFQHQATCFDIFFSYFLNYKIFQLLRSKGNVYIIFTFDLLNSFKSGQADFK